jgi:HEAT repeat protein
VTEPAPARDDGARRVYVLWGAGLGFLLLLALACWGLVVPYFQARAVARAYRTSEVKLEEAIRRLGGPGRAARCFSVYLLAPGKKPSEERWRIMEILGHCGRPAVGTLIRGITDPDITVRWMAMGALGTIGPEARAAVGPLAEALADLGGSEPPPAATAAWALGEIGPAAKSALPALEVALVNPNHNVRCRAARAIWQITGEGERLVPALIEIVNLGYYNSAGLAGDTLVRIGSEAVPKLCEALKSKEWDARYHAAEVLGLMGPRAAAAVPALQAALQDERELVRSIAASALRKVRGEEPPKL